jgi:filamentous hemagglutinin family protein
MNKSPFPFQLFTALAFCYLTAPPTLAQIVPDTTLPINSTVTNSDNTDIIDGGTKAGNNLFHSFREFSVPTGGTAFFNNSLDVQNIITRVTGSSISNIDGILKANGANLFLLNPNGIIFGENAQLKIGGSFLASTADSLIFADGTQFSAKNPQTTPLLTISVPIGLQLGTANPIVVRGPGQNLIPDEETGAIVREDDTAVGLAVETGRSLVLAGGDIQLQGGNLTAPAGRISLLAVRRTEVRTPNGASLLTSDILPLAAGSPGNIEMSQKATVDASGTRGGDIQLAGRNIRLTEGSAVLSLTREAQLGGNLNVTAAEAIEIIGSPDGQLSGFLLETIGEGNGGNLQISARRVLLRDGGQATTSTLGNGRAGNVRVDVSESIEAVGTTPAGEPSGLFTQTESAGAAGDLTINTGRLLVSEGALVSTTALGSGDAGNLTVNASESVEVIGVDTPGNPPLSALSSSTEGEGAGGNLRIDTKRLIIRDGAEVFASTFGAGKAGDLQIHASESIVISGANNKNAIFARVNATATGDGGNLTVETRQLIIQNGAQISSSTSSTGNGGNVILTARDSVEISGNSASGLPSGIFTQVDDENARGNGGNLTVETRQLRVLDGAQISAGTIGIGRGGDVTVNASESVELSGVSPRINPETNSPFTSGLFARTRGSGNAGSVNIFTDRLTVRNGAEAAVDARLGGGDAGNLEIRSREIRLLDRGVLTAETAVGEGGNIRINASAIGMRDRSRISTSAGTSQRPGNGGNINIKTDTLAGVRNSDISANSFEGSGGRIEINAQAVLGFQTPTRQDLADRFGTENLIDFDPQNLSSSDITAISLTNPNLSGTVEINTPDIDPSSGLIAVPQPGVTAIVQNPCAAGNRSSFVNVGRGGLPPNPREIVSNSAANSEDNLTTELVEAQGWERDADGTIRLVARSRNVTPYSNWQNRVKCD